MPVGREKIYDTLRAATFGLISAVLLGGPLARTLIVKNNLKPNEDEEFAVDVSDINASTGEKLSGLDIIKNITVILVCMAIGTIVSGWIGKAIGMSFPTYVGAMFIAVIVRNLNEKFHWYNFSFGLVDGIGDAMLNALKGCTVSPYEMMELGLQGLELVTALIGKSNATAASDLGCAALNLKSGIQGAWLNVCININGMSDQAFTDEYRAKGQAILDKALPMADAAYAAILEQCNS